jgi:hypothetical protein
MSDERNGVELLRAFWRAVQALKDVDVHVAAPHLLLAADRFVAGEAPDAIAKDVLESLPAHLRQPQDAVSRFLRDRDLKNARRPNPLAQSRAGGGDAPL